MSDRSVYQLERYKNEKGSKIKLSLISGVSYLLLRVKHSSTNLGRTFSISFGKRKFLICQTIKPSIFCASQIGKA